MKRSNNSSVQHFYHLSYHPIIDNVLSTVKGMSSRGGIHSPLSPASWRIHPGRMEEQQHRNGRNSPKVSSGHIECRKRDICFRCKNGWSCPVGCPFSPGSLPRAACTHAVIRPLLTPLRHPSLSSSSLPSSLGVPTFTPLFHRSTAILDMCIYICICVHIYIYRCACRDSS